MRWTPVGRQVLPDGVANRARGAGRGDAEQADAADDEGHHGRLQVDAGSIAAACDVSVRMDDARQPGEHVAADVVDRSGPTARFERALAPVQILARDTLLCAERDQVVEMFELA